MWTQNDLKLLEEKGISIEEVNRQLDFFRNGFPYASLDRPAVPGDGIRVPGLTEQEHYSHAFESSAPRMDLLKFVPASGAATRMFKDLFEWKNALDKGITSLTPSAREFLANLHKFAFYPELKKVLVSHDITLQEKVRPEQYSSILSAFLDREGMNYGSLPKGLILFHAYPGGARTALEEHLTEAALYAKGAGDRCRLHFTVSPEHRDAFIALFMEKKAFYERLFQVTYEVEFSVQKPSTDTIAADAFNQPFRDTNGNLVFRPGGHGALLENLQSLQADLIFIKNIDNVVPDHLKEPTVHWKKVLGGILLSLREKVFYFLENLRKNPSSELINEALLFVEQEFHYNFKKSGNQKEFIDFLIDKLDRPIRVCGMVKNEGEPGGGPFWVRQTDGTLSLQIVELSQINQKDAEQWEIVRKSTHFNPVDLVCSIRKPDGTNYELPKFRDPQTGFISVKSKDGKELKALELPGLWNGSMAGWNTVFVDVPLATFNPVKTVFDLLRDAHQ